MVGPQNKDYSMLGLFWSPSFLGNYHIWGVRLKAVGLRVFMQVVVDQVEKNMEHTVEAEFQQGFI